MLYRWLLRPFRTPEAASSPDARGRAGKLSGRIGILCNLLLFFGKLLAGLLSGSVSVIADAVNNLSDAAGSVVTLFGFRLAAKPADSKHPYGHDRLEYFSGLAVAVLILLVGCGLAKSSAERIFYPSPVDFPLLTIVILCASLAVKLWLALFNRTLGRLIHSPALLASAADAFNDMISTTAVLIAGVISRLTGVTLDGYLGLAVAVFIIIGGIRFIRDTANPLLGEAPDEKLVRAITAEIRHAPQVLGIHDLIIHEYGPGRRFASVHVEIDHRIEPLIAHEVIDSIEHKVKTDLHTELVIHYDPVVTDDPVLNRMKDTVRDTLAAVDPAITFHDPRLIHGAEGYRLFLDIVLPVAFTGNAGDVERKLEDALAALTPPATPVITFDSEFFNDLTGDANAPKQE